MIKNEAIKTIKKAIDSAYNTNQIFLYEQLIKLKEYLNKLHKDNISLDFYKIRVLELEKNKNLFPNPYFTMICNLLANGKMEI